MSLFAELRQLEEKGIDLVEILGQDRHLESPEVLQEIVSRLSKSGENLHSELLYYLTYRRFPPDQAESLWRGILRHKRKLQSAVGRNVAFRVAALDYLAYRTNVLRGVHLIARPEFEGVLSYVNVDEVSGVYSRHFFNRQLSLELNRARRYGSPLSLLLLDLDGFKQVNDNIGHVEGDKVLRRIGRLLKDTTRQTDAPCRFGGDEFAILLPETSHSEAYSTAERIREAAGGIEVGLGQGKSVRMTASIGGATFPTDCDEAEELIALADQMCLDAKRSGKNRVRLYGETHDLPIEMGDDLM